MKRKNFTLLELLIVVAVIAILAGLLLPVLNSARNTALSISCTGRLKMIGAAQAMYSSDWNDWIVPALTDSTEGQSQTWAFKLGTGGIGNISRTPYGIRYYKIKNDSNGQIADDFRCPSDPRPISWAPGYVNPFLISHFASNLYLGGSSNADYHKTSAVTSGSIAIFAADSSLKGAGSLFHYDNFSFRHGIGDSRANAMTTGPDATEIPFAKSMTNIVYIDGHASSKNVFGLFQDSADAVMCVGGGGRHENSKKSRLAGLKN